MHILVQGLFPDGRLEDDDCGSLCHNTGQMSGQVSRGSAGEYQADERAGVARLSWRLSVR